MNSPSTTAEPAAAEEFSLVRGDLLFRLQRRLGLIPANGFGLVRRAVFWSLLGWLPTALWAAYVHRALPGAEAAEPLLAHFGIHARLLIAVPLLIFAEGPASTLTARLLRHFVESGVLSPGARSTFNAELARFIRLRDSSLPWLVIIAIVAAFATLSEVLTRIHEVEWAAAAPTEIGFGGLWYLFGGRSIYFILVLGWAWRIVLLTGLLRRIARLELSLVPTHPDRAGGLGFLERLPTVFAPLPLAVGAVLASRWAHDAIYHGLVLQSLRVEMVAFVVICVVVLCLPLLVFAGPLKRAKRQALLDYGTLVGKHGRLVHQRWIEGRQVGKQPLLEAPELGPVADTAAVYDAVKRMRTVPLGKSSVLPIALAAAAPILFALALQMPVKELALTLLKATL